MEEAIKLLEHWKRFIDEGNQENFGEFGKWLEQKNPEKPNTYFSEPFMEDTNATFGYYLGSVIGFADAWERLTFRDLSINGFIDFGILKQVQYEANPTKKELARRSTGEQSTVFEAIKRMQKKGLIRDEVDEKDRRVKRVYLTESGADVIQQVEGQAFKLSNLLVGDLTSQELATITGLLKKLNDFHQNLHENYSKEDVAKKYDL
ncbi:hypothetical protein BFP97_03210 [Roseivirga sp. 4D4]|uniref:MarR family winged helix-turn-helix transcriptional regulator n=1 Tax=Roseivirga sp. 4D4 TaxID=1889784 RepID=UPI000852A336|nr:winged helix DNA-binding protein [Roseivirga sp. 4D4]OEK00573.1 hypothetical protein BFP97_03210 [Roseivirga sp. 4D4]